MTSFRPDTSLHKTAEHLEGRAPDRQKGDKKGMDEMRVERHPILGEQEPAELVEITVDGKKLTARSGEMIAAVLMANGIMIHRHTAKNHEARGIFCGIGQCTDCVMTVNGKPNVRTCITPVEAGMVVETQEGYGKRRS